MVPGCADFKLREQSVVTRVVAGGDQCLRIDIDGTCECGAELERRKRKDAGPAAEVEYPQACERVKDMIGKISKRSVAKVKLYHESQPIFDRFGITRQLEATVSRQVHLKGGGHIVIDETEALVAIDVNTGRHKGQKDLDSTIIKVNLEAAEEICRQLRLRNMGGLIVLDFIDMRSRKDQQSVYQRMREHLKRDRAKTHIRSEEHTSELQSQ